MEYVLNNVWKRINNHYILQFMSIKGKAMPVAGGGGP
jgi:hypothetical protein